MSSLENDGEATPVRLGLSVPRLLCGQAQSRLPELQQVPTLLCSMRKSLAGEASRCSKPLMSATF